MDPARSTQQPTKKKPETKLLTNNQKLDLGPTCCLMLIYLVLVFFVLSFAFQDRTRISLSYVKNSCHSWTYDPSEQVLAPAPERSRRRARYPTSRNMLGPLCFLGKI